MEQVPVTKTCIKCGQTKEHELFEKDNRNKDGRRNACKKCRKEAAKYYNTAEKKRQELNKLLKSEEPPLVKTCTNCKETKEFELFAEDKSIKFGRKSICKECFKVKSKESYLRLKERGVKKLNKKPLNYKEPPPTMVCGKCKETKESRFFVKDNYKKTGLRNRCLECNKVKSKNRYIKRKEKEEKLFKDNTLIDKLTRTCCYCNETKPLSFFIKKITGKFGKSPYCKKCDSQKKKLWIESKPALYREKINERVRKASKEEVETLHKNYLKSVLYKKFNIPRCEITDEQLELQKESIQLHREHKQLKLFLWNNDL